MRVLKLLPVAFLLGASLLGGLIAGGCSGDAKTEDGTKNPEAKRMSSEEFEQKRAKKGGDDSK